MVPKLQQDRTCVYSPIGLALAMVRLDEIGVYIDQCLNMVAQYIVTRPIMDLCLAAERNPGIRLSMRWLGHTTLDILGGMTQPSHG